MSIRTDSVERSWLHIVSVLAVLFAISVSAASRAASSETKQTDGEHRSSTTLHIRSGGRGNRDGAVSTVDDYDPLVITGKRIGPAAGTKPGAATATAETASYDFWFYTADVVLFSDDDHDGYYYGIDLLFDADTIYSSADVYAAVYLSLDGGPWNEYAVTEDFTLFGAQSDDEYVLVTELMSGYPTGSYDLLIELYDAWDGSFLASFGPEDTSELAYLPLEDYDRDAPRYVRPAGGHHGGGGATSLWLLLPLVLMALWRRPRVPS